MMGLRKAYRENYQGKHHMLFFHGLPGNRPGELTLAARHAAAATPGSGGVASPRPSHGLPHGSPVGIATMHVLVLLRTAPGTVVWSGFTRSMRCSSSACKICQ